MPLLLLFLIIPLIEIGLFIQVGDLIGLWWTLLTVVITAIVGASLVRHQGAGVLRRVQSSFNTLQDPSQPLAEGAMILFSGALLLTPGFFTDAVGFALLIPGIRVKLFDVLRKRIKVTGSARFKTHVPPSQDIVEGEFEEQPSSQSDRSSGPSGWTRH